MNAIPPDLEEFLRESGFRDPSEARKRLHELFRDPAEMLALARLSGLLKDLVGGCPDPDAALLQLSRFVEVRGSRLQLYRSFLDHPALLDRFVRVVSSSRYLADILVRNPDYLGLLSDSALLARPRPPEELDAELARLGELFPSEEAALEGFRRIHRREMLRIGAADLLGFQDLPQVTRQISELADVFVRRCLGRDSSGLIVLALGKWGGNELNYSSDIDVIFLAPRARDLPGATRAAQRLIRALSEPTVEGVVYRVDLRLRPYGSEGALVVTTDAFEDYLRSKADPAERQAMLKARVVAGRTAAGRTFLKRALPLLLQDASSARRKVRSLKSRIEKQLSERGSADGHVKLAPGGIRDVEFLVQALQLEGGGARPGVLGGHTLEALAALERAGLVASDDAQALREAYIFLRAVEHRVQLMENQQVYRLPRKEEDLERLGRTLGFPGPDAAHRLLDAYDARTRKVRALFDRVLDSPAADDSPEPVHLESVRRQMGTACERLDARLIRSCAELVERVQRPEDVALEARRNDRERWTVVACTADLGLLPFLAGLFTARRVNIRSGDFLKVRFEAPRRRTAVTRKVLGIFEVDPPAGIDASFWDSLRESLAELARLAAADRVEAAREKIIDQVGEALRPARGPESPLLPVRISIRNDPGARETELHIHSVDTLGFVFEFATALSALNLSVERAVIRTLEDEVYDTFWVTTLQGRRIEDPKALDELRVAAALVKQFMHLLPRSPNPAQALRQFTALLNQMFARPEWVPQLRNLESRPVLTTIAELMGVSRFLWEDFLLLQHENLFPVVLDVPTLRRPRTRAQMERELARSLGRRKGGEALARLNEFKDREMFRIDLRHITRRSDFREFMASLSDLAEVVVGRAAGICEAELRGAPRKRSWTIGGLGKFGGRELGLGSDLDLVFVYEGGGAEAYIELVKALLQALRARREGSFGIDLRLRPHGDSGAVASSLGGFLEYYSDRGPAQPFERMALVKLRPVAGSARLGAKLLAARDAFVYSGRPVDYANLLHLRRRQAAELVPAGEVDAKYSPGGLVDVEYFVQARQIEAGHRDPSVRVANTLEAIERLVRGGHFRAELGGELCSAYLFLRRLIDALRVVRGYAQDSRIPASSLREFSYLVRRLDYASPASLEAEIRQKTSFARNVWNEVRFR